MKEKIADFFKSRRREILPFALSTVMSLGVFSVYSIPLFSFWTAGILIFTAAMFLLCNFTNKHHLAGGIMIAFLAVFLLRTFFSLIFGYDWGAGFQRWFLTGADEAETQTEYILALLVSFVPFFAVSVYYFSCVLYRMSFLTLVSIIPFALSVKVLTDINNVYIALIAMLNIAVLMTSLREKSSSGRITAGNRAAVFSASVFAFVLLMISALIPKESEARYYDEFERLFMNSENNRPLSDYSVFSEFSGGPDSFRNFSNRYLYMLYGEGMTYFKRQTFDLYDMENLRWYSDPDYSEPYCLNEEWAEEAEKRSLEKLRNAIIAADGYSEGFSDKYGLSRLAGFSDFSDELRIMNVIPENFGAVYYIAPARTVKIIPNSKRDMIYVTRGGVFRNKELPHDPNMSYQLMYYDEFRSRYLWLQLGGADFDNEKCVEMLSELCDILSENNDPLYENAEAFLNVHTQAMEYRTPEYEKNTEEISPEIKAFAEEITAGLEYDWQKAEALQTYFTSNGYIYDLNYIPSDPSVEYFLFESKRGSCTHYATAYVLMARSLGLTVRYTEGYSPDITGRDNVFSVKDSCSHAYPEVYIQNMGWIVFEPTIAGDYSLSSDTERNTGFELKVDYSLVFVICVISGILLILALAAVLLIPAAAEKRFIRRISKMPPEECIRQVYIRISRKISASVFRHSDAMTPYELALEIERLTGCETGNFAFIAENALFDSNADISGKDAAIAAYEKIRFAVRSYTKEQKKLRRMNRKGRSRNEK
ncbi:MAG: transglutaminase domain-containing protein [Oscillospiraceae bacterium]|nr:transglutaminase domain-containing protein [Oscillospiraceae bacterium]